jgi:N-methylhydantoinase A
MNGRPTVSRKEMAEGPLAGQDVTMAAVDIGGTFTDLALAVPQGKVSTAKVLTTPGDLARGVVEVLRLSGVRAEDVGFFVHGTTAGLNAVLEGRFATVGLLTTKGFRDVYEIGRANRPAMYDLYYHRPKPLVPRRLRLEVTERMSARGEVIIPLDEGSLRQSADALVSAGAEAIAVVLLHAYANPSHELRCEELLHEWYPGVRVSLSHRIANEWREYERTSTTVMNAAIGATVDSYLAGLERELRDEGVSCGVHVMQSNGGMTTVHRARAQPVNTLLSGPVGGAIAAAEAAREAGFSAAIAIDMGGTSFDVSLVSEGQPQLAREAQLLGHPLLLPVVDVHTIGSGGGSVAWVSAGGLRVGPQSAGARPGPACYGQGGTEATVTDANVVLDRVNCEHFLGGGMRLEPKLAEEALRRLGKQLGLGVDSLAAGILDVVNAQMASLMRQITIGRGIDPRRLVLIAFGGAGPMHAVYLAEELGIRAVVVPYSPGTFSAQGMLLADITHDVVRPLFCRFDRLDHGKVEALLAEMQAEAGGLLAEDNVPVDRAKFSVSADVRYVGQEHALTLPFRRLDAKFLAGFHRTYRRTFGHANPDELVEVVALRMKAIGSKRCRRLLTEVPSGGGKPYLYEQVRVRGERVRVPRFYREDLPVGKPVRGPLIVDEPSCTTVVPDGWALEATGLGFLQIARDQEDGR